MTRLTRTMLILVGGFVGGSLLFSIWAIAPLFRPAPVISSTKILDREGGLLYEVAQAEEGTRTAVGLAEAPSFFLEALVASEDARFYRHHGVDVTALGRAASDILRYGSPQSGGSTLEQQVVKDRYFKGKPRTILQKLREIVAARYWSATHSKEETLEMYVNAVYFGNRSYGVAAAARTYFRKDVQDLSRAESALLVGILPAPSEYDPYREWKNARARQTTVLDRLVSNGKIDEAAREEILASDIELFRPRHEITAPHFVFRVLSELERDYPDIEAGGYIVKTTLDSDLQRLAEETVTRRLRVLSEQHVTNGAAMVLDPRSGEILAYVGSEDYHDDDIQGQVDMVRAKRQPGSALKPFLYLLAFMQGMTPATVIADLPVRFETADGKGYYPRNYSYRYFGPVSLRDALGSSLNIPAVKVLGRVGLPRFVSFLERLGIAFPESAEYYGLGIVLGGGEVTMEEIAKAYASLALSGRSVEIQDVLEVTRTDGSLVWKKEETRHEPLFDDARNAEQAAALVTDILTDKTARARSFGETNLLDVGRRIAVKTGTTRDFHDNWAFGYTPEFVLGVWVGNADGTPMQGVSGITGAVPIWHDIMMRRYERTNEVAWPSVEGIVTRSVCTTSGLLATETCPKTRQEKFIEGTEPKESDSWYVNVDIDAPTGLLAAAGCKGPTIQKTFLRPPSEYAAWQVAAQHELPPTRDCRGALVATPSTPVILSPLDGDIFEQDGIVDASSMRIPFIAGGGSGDSVVWILDGQRIESPSATYFWSPTPGEHVLTLEQTHQQIHFSVR